MNDAHLQRPTRRPPTEPGGHGATPVTLLDEAWPIALCRPSEAQPLIERWAATAAPDDDCGWIFHAVVLGHVLIRQGDVAGAAQCSARAQARLESAALAPASHHLLEVRACTLAAVLCVYERRFEAAVERLNRVLRNAAALPVLDRFYACYVRGLMQVSLGRQALAFSDLMVEYDFIARHHPALFAVLSLNIGAVLIHVGDWNGAEQSLRAAMARIHLVEPAVARIICRMNLAYALLQRGQVQQARALMQEALAADREFTLRVQPGDVFATAGESLILTGHLEEARSYLAGLHASASGSGYRIGIGSAEWCTGLLARHEGDVAAAQRHWRTALLKLRHAVQLPHRWKTMRAISEIYAQARDWRRAWRWQRRFHAAFVQWEEQVAEARLAIARQRLELRQARSQALQDPLSGLLNRRALFEQLSSAIDGADVYRQPLQVCMIDLDNLKPINDHHGHNAGDAAIAVTAQSLRDVFGHEVLAYRYGGDEFVAILPDMDVEDTEEALGRFLDALRQWRPAGASSERRTVLSASIGLASFPADGVTADRLLDAADTALYRAKKAGGNRIVRLS